MCRISRAQLVSIVASLLLGGAPAAAQEAREEPKPVNLLRLPKVTLERVGGIPSDSQSAAALTDGGAKTVFTATASKDDPLVVVYSLGSATVALEGLGVFAPLPNGDAGPPAEVDLLVSTLSPHAGFQAVRSFDLAPVAEPQQFTFPPVAAKWVMLRFVPNDRFEQVAVAELALRGRLGPPVTRYAFKEAPATALAMLARLKNSSTLDLAVSQDEAALLADAGDGRLDDWTFAEAALLVSGVADASQRKTLVAELDRLEAGASKRTAAKSGAFDQAQALLEYLHDAAMREGYAARQSDLSAVLESGKFNCVSSATLFNVIGRRLMLDCRAIERTHHVLSIVYDGPRHADVETTIRAGFNPARDRAAQEALVRTTGLAYVPDANQHERRELGEVGLLAFVYYNRGVEQTRDKRYHEALVNYFRAMSLDPELASAIKNALATLANWSLELAEQQKFEAAIEVLTIGLDLAPRDATLVANHKAIWTQWAQSLTAAGKTDEALEVLARAAKAAPDGNFIRLQAWAFIGPGEAAVEAGDWPRAAAQVEPGLSKLAAGPREEMATWASSFYHRWANHELERGRYEQAIQVLQAGAKSRQNDKSLASHLGFVVQEWLRDVLANQGPQDAARTLAGLRKLGDVPEVNKAARNFMNRGVNELVTAGKFDEARSIVESGAPVVADAELQLQLLRFIYDRWAERLMKQADWSAAIDLYGQALKQHPHDKHFNNNLRAAWSAWMRSYAEWRDWSGALDVCEAALKRHPDPASVKSSVSFYVQEWAGQAQEKAGPPAAAAVLAQQVARFAAVEELRSVALGHVQRAVHALIAKENFDDAARTIEANLPLLKAESKFASLAEFAYDKWGTHLAGGQKWPEAVEVYARGLQQFPASGRLEQNAVATWYAWAKVSMDAKDWPAASKIFERALERFPKNETLASNLDYCRRQPGK